MYNIFELIDFRETVEGRGRERNNDLLLIYAFIGCFLYVPRLGIEPVTLAYWDDALTNCYPARASLKLNA